jgi:hypothetical protein
MRRQIRCTATEPMNGTGTASLAATVAELVRERDRSIRELVSQTGAAPVEIETALFNIADPICDRGDLVLANQARFHAANFDRWPEGVAAEIVTIWESIAWRYAGSFVVAKSPTRWRRNRRAPG